MERTAQRRTQAERRAGTQAAMLDATLDCLVELGYAGTTTREVARRAGASRGAQTHHYPTKIDLVSAAIERLFDQQAQRFADGFAALPESERTLDRALAVLWDVVRGPTYAPVLEVTVASRTDPQLRVVVHAMSAVLERTIAELFDEFFPSLASDDTTARGIVDLGFAILQGAAVSSYAGFGDPDHAIELTRTLAQALAPAAPPAAGSAATPSQRSTR